MSPVGQKAAGRSERQSFLVFDRSLWLIPTTPSLLLDPERRDRPWPSPEFSIEQRGARRVGVLLTLQVVKLVESSRLVWAPTAKKELRDIRRYDLRVASRKVADRVSVTFTG
jgi:hypothetical protein